MSKSTDHTPPSFFWNVRPVPSPNCLFVTTLSAAAIPEHTGSRATGVILPCLMPNDVSYEVDSQVRLCFSSSQLDLGRVGGQFGTCARSSAMQIWVECW